MNEEKVDGQHGKKSIKFIDSENRTIAQFLLADNTTNKYNKTYFVYDELGRVVYTITPKAVDILEQNSWTITQQILDNLCSYATYDDLGRLIESKTASVDGRQQLVYDLAGRVILTQNPKQEIEQKWSFVVYDALGRASFSGFLTSAENRNYWQYILDGTGTAPTNLPNVATLNDPSEIYTYLINGVNLIQNGGDYPSSLNNCDINSYLYFDSYDHSFLSGMLFNSNHNNYFYPDAYSQANATNFSIATYPTNGLSTCTKTRILKPSNSLSTLDDWKIQVMYYDNFGRLIQAQDKIIDITQNGNIEYHNTVSTQYDWSGRTLRIVNENMRTGVNGTSMSFIGSNIITTKFEYQPITFKLLKVSQNPNNQGWVLLSQNTYDPVTGALKIKNIGNVEIQNYTYNIRGQLTGINPIFAEQGTPAPKVSFGESIKYDYGFADNRYDGKISGIIWKTASTRSRAYKYTYNQAGFLTQANFTQLDGASYSTPSDWGINNTDYSEKDYTYDGNGNMLTLKRKGDGAGNIPVTVDELTYNYENAGESNRLESVDDASNFQPAVANIEQDFQDHNPNSVDYVYDAHGNITQDLNKQIIAITYNEVNKPWKIEFANGSFIENIYDAGGQKMGDIKNVGGNPLVTRLFNGSFVFEDGIPKTIEHPEGRVRLIPVSNTSNYNFQYDYFVKDHLGNVRTTLTAEVIPISNYFADHEIAYANIENLVFDNIDNVRASKPNSPSEKVAKLDANIPTQRVGTSLLLHVMAGDKFNFNVNAYYENTTTGSNGVVSPADMLSSIINELTGNQTGFNTEAVGNTSNIVNGVFTNPNYINVYNNIKNNNTDPTKPRAYINYIVFDEKFNIINDQSGAIQVNTANTWHNIALPSEITLKQGGYLVVYLSNESLDNVVMFDELTINHIQGKLLEENHYYPYGMCLRISQNATIQPENKKLYQSKEFCTDENLNIYDFDARQYDPLLGRFTSLDPMGQYASGYVGMDNNPTNNIDPSGMWANATSSASSLGYDYNNAVERWKKQDEKKALIDKWNKEQYWQEMNSPKISEMLDHTQLEFEDQVNAQNARHDEMARQNLIREISSKLEGGATSAEMAIFQNTPVGDLTAYNDKLDIDNGKNNTQVSGEGDDGNKKKNTIYNVTVSDGNTVKKRSDEEGINVNADLNNDGILTLNEAKNHYKFGNGIPIWVSANLIDISNVNPKLFHSIGDKISVNFLSPNVGPLYVGVVYGRLDLTLVSEDRVRITSNTYDFSNEGHSWKSEFFRNTFTVLGGVYNGEGTPYMINFYGTAKLSAPYNNDARLFYFNQR